MQSGETCLWCQEPARTPRSTAQSSVRGSVIRSCRMKAREAISVTTGRPLTNRRIQWRVHHRTPSYPLPNIRALHRQVLISTFYRLHPSRSSEQPPYSILSYLSSPPPAPRTPSFTSPPATHHAFGHSAPSLRLESALHR